jgi:hypothetical protein
VAELSDSIVAFLAERNKNARSLAFGFSSLFVRTVRCDTARGSRPIPSRFLLNYPAGSVCASPRE